MATKVKTHKRKKKNGVSVVKEYSRKDGKPTRKGSGEEYTKKKGSSCAGKSKKACGKSCD